MSLNGVIRVPGDKSISHRAVLFAALAEGSSYLTDLLPSDDVMSSLGAVEELGAEVKTFEGDNGIDAIVTGFGGESPYEYADIDCGNSGTTTRLLMGMACGLGIEVDLSGDESLGTRPMERVMEPLRQMGASFESEGGTLPVTINPVEGLQAIHYDSPKASAQVKSALLLAGLQAEGVTSVTEPAKSRDHTELMLPAFGVPVATDGLTVSVEGPATLQGCDVTIPGDPSSAAFVAVAAAIVEESEVLIENVCLNPTRTGAFEVLRRMGAALEYEDVHEEGGEQVGDIRVAYMPGLQATVVTPDEIPTLIDEIPVLAIAAAHAEGETVFQSCGELRVKESDRLQAILDGLEAFGIEAFAEGDDLHIIGQPDEDEIVIEIDEELLADGDIELDVAEMLGLNLDEADIEVEFAEEEGEGPEDEDLEDEDWDEDDEGLAYVEMEVHHDHRLAMAWYIASLSSEVAVFVDDPDCVSVSWPTFYEDIERLMGC